MTDWITITIDGQEIKAKNGELLTDAAARAGIDIPIFCSHPKLDPLGACRMCLVEQETPRGNALITACTTPVRDGSVFLYNSERAMDAREGTLELILINHPLDCPICDKGGECPLQNQTMEHGPGKSQFWEVKTHKAKNYPLSDLILIDQERCIVCWRCIRYLQEWEDKPQLGLFHRGGETVIDKFPDGSLDAYTSGSIIDLCPVGALTNRRARFAYRPWEVQSTPSLCTQCGQGCNLRIDARTHTVRRHVGRENMAVNDEWICDKGRFAVDSSKHDQRLQQPLIRKDGELTPVSWPEAIQHIVTGLQGVVRNNGPKAVGGIGSAKLSNEANYLLGKFMRGLIGTNNLDYREGSALLADPRGLPALADVNRADTIVLMGCDPSEEMPVLANFIKRAVIRRGAKLVIIHPRRIELVKYADVFLNPMPGDEPGLFDALTRSTLDAREDGSEEPLPAWLTSITVSDDLSQDAIAQAAAYLSQAEHPFVVYGADYAWGYASQDIVTSLTNWVISAGCADRLGFLQPQANAQGARDMGMLPDRLPGHSPLSDRTARTSLEAVWGTAVPSDPGLGFGGMISAAIRGDLKALYVMGADPVAEKSQDADALRGLDFLVVQDIFLTQTARLADVVLPAASYAETAGTFTNTERRVQRAPQAVRPVAKSVPDWAILMHLMLAYAPEQVAAWPTTSVEAIFAEISQAVPPYATMSWQTLGEEGCQWSWSAVAVEHKMLSHRIPELSVSDTYPFRLVIGSQLWDEGTILASNTDMGGLGVKGARLHPSDAADLQIHDGELIAIRSAAGAIELAAHLDDAIKPGTVFVPYSLIDAPVGDLFDKQGPRSAVSIQRL